MTDWQQIKTDSSLLSHCSDYFREHISLCLPSINSFDSPTSAELFWELVLSDEGSLAWREGVGDLGDSVQSRKIHFSLIIGAQMMEKFFQMAHSQKLSSRYWILLESSPVPCLLVSGTLNLICRITFRKWCFFRTLFSSLWYGASSYLTAPLPCGTGESFYLQAPSPLGMIPLRNMLVLMGKSVRKQHRIIPDSASPTSWMFVLCPSLSVSLGIVGNSNQEGELRKCLCYQYSVVFCKYFRSTKTRVFNLGWGGHMGVAWGFIVYLLIMFSPPSISFEKWKFHRYYQIISSLGTDNLCSDPLFFLHNRGLVRDLDEAGRLEVCVTVLIVTFIGLKYISGSGSESLSIED